MDPSLTESMKSWLLNYILEFRAEAARNAEYSGQGTISNLDDFSPPCQVHLFWFRLEGIFDFSLLLCTRLKSLPDLLVEVVGPVPPPKIDSTLLEVLRWPRWDETLDDPGFLRIGDGSARFAVAQLLGGAKEAFREFLVQEVFSRASGGARISRFAFLGNGFTWQILGDLRAIDVRQLVRDSFQQRVQPVSAMPVREPQKSASIEGFGTYFFPRLVIGNLRSPTPEDVLLGKNLPGSFGWAPKALDARYLGATLVVNQDGFIGIEAKSTRVALDRLNLIIASLLLDGVPLTAIREVELGKINIDPESLTITSYSSELASLRNAPAFGGVGPSLTPALDFALIKAKKRHITEVQLQQIVARCEKISKNQVLTNQLLFLLEAYTHLSASEFRQSFIMAWLAIESWLEKQWSAMLRSKGISKQRHDRFMSSDPWTAELRTEVLNLLDIVNHERFESLNKARKTRNRVVHDGYNPTKDEASEVFELALKVLEEQTEDAEFS